ncbi:glycosyl hydrolase family 20 protein [Nitzschia inconspicua]|uniref:Glycosyl hydrolase family 20 protein n=1 Tax=Nitzschia inconspicua TaxID=303405 RepID=A0A9K3KZJ6_9STRA|nr:glycosyl hydrolase family 20 protein [Nitzschia inconspicua]
MLDRGSNGNRALQSNPTGTSDLRDAPTSRRRWCRPIVMIRIVLVILIVVFLTTTLILLRQLEDSSEHKSGFVQNHLSGEITVVVDDIQVDGNSNEQVRQVISLQSFQKAAAAEAAVNNHRIQTHAAKQPDNGTTSVRPATHITSHTKVQENTLPPYPPFLEYMGVLLDAGRHYFPLEWLYGFFLPNLHAMDYNYVHFRLTDDQNFVVNLTVNVPSKSSQPIPMGYTARTETTTSGMYQPQELHDLVRYAKEHYNITMIPEVNVPGHAGAWGASFLPELVLKCPNFVCMTGYGVPLDVSSPILPSVLHQILSQVVEIFDHPPLLHLGGDELHMSEKCLIENFWWHQKHNGGKMDSVRFNRTEWLYNDVKTFEETVLQPVVTGLGYKMDQILRWETTDMATATPPVHRTGSITHYWHTTPMSAYQVAVVSNAVRKKRKKTAAPTVGPYVASTGLYLDLVSGSGYGYGDYLAARSLVTEKTRPFAIVVGTFELSTAFWEYRNVLGRLLAIRMGISSSTNYSASTISNATVPEPISKDKFFSDYEAQCNNVFVSQKSANYYYREMCDLKGSIRIDDKNYQLKWKSVWKEWKEGLCKGLTVQGKDLHIHPMAIDVTIQRQANYYYFDNLLLPMESWMHNGNVLHSDSKNNRNELVRPAAYGAIFLDLVRNHVSKEGFAKLVELVKSSGLTAIQLRLADDFGQVVEYQSVPNIAYSAFTSESAGQVQSFYHRRHLKFFVRLAEQAGISIIPEINLATSAGGWIKSGMLMNCPHTLCHRGEGMALDVAKNLDGVLPVCMAVILELIQLFLSSPSHLGPSIHLGSDERELVANSCFMEAGYGTKSAHDALANFEEKMSQAFAAIGVDEDYIVRWNNQENVRYPNRTGSITQYLSSDDVDNLKTFSRYLGTTLAYRESSSWEIFSATRRWMEKDTIPWGMLLKNVDDGFFPSFSQMVAFHLAMSGNITSDDKSSFLQQQESWCKALNCSGKDLIVQELRASHPIKSLDLNAACLGRTQNVTVKLAKPSPFG